MKNKLISDYLTAGAFTLGHYYAKVRHWAEKKIEPTGLDVLYSRLLRTYRQWKEERIIVRRTAEGISNPSGLDREFTVQNTYKMNTAWEIDKDAPDTTMSDLNSEFDNIAQNPVKPYDSTNDGVIMRTIRKDIEQ